MRPVYENSTTLAAEDRLASKLSDQWSCKTTKLGRKYKVDYALSRGGVIYAWAELKKRNIPSNRYSEYMLSLDKYLTAQTLAQQTDTKCLLVVEFSDCVLYTDLATVKFRLGMGGRKDRGDPEDYEPCCWMPLDQFKEINFTDITAEMEAL